MHRAAHQILDAPSIFPDPLALKIVGPEAEAALQNGSDRRIGPRARFMRAFLVARSRFAEDRLFAAYESGTRQYVLLGAGLDTFAYRGLERFPGLSVFEVDHPSTQSWKMGRLAEAQIAIPERVVHVPVNFERQNVVDCLARTAFDFTKPAFFAWLGVVPYLTRDAITTTLSLIAARMAKGSEIVFDFSAMPKGLWARLRFRAMASRVAALGEPFRSSFEPEEIAGILRALGYSKIEIAGSASLNAAYFAGRRDGLRLAGRGHIMHATL